MRINIMLGLDNADFDDNLEAALSGMLHELAEQIAASDLKPGWVHVIKDTNGNRIGVADVFGPDRIVPGEGLMTALLTRRVQEGQ